MGVEMGCEASPRQTFRSGTGLSKGVGLLGGPRVSMSTKAEEPHSQWPVSGGVSLSSPWRRICLWCSVPWTLQIPTRPRGASSKALASVLREHPVQLMALARVST